MTSFSTADVPDTPGQRVIVTGISEQLTGISEQLSGMRFPL